MRVINIPFDCSLSDCSAAVHRARGAEVISAAESCSDRGRARGRSVTTLLTPGASSSSSDVTLCGDQALINVACLGCLELAEAGPGLEDHGLTSTLPLVAVRG